MQQSELISVVLPCYNGEKTLEKCLDSINRQKAEIELIFINDGSIDSSLAIFNNFHFNRSITTRIISRENKGFLFSLNEAIKISTGEFIARIDVDDIWMDNHLELLINEFIKDENLVLAGSLAKIIDENDNIIGEYDLPLEHSQIIKYLHKDCAFIHSSVMFKKSTYWQTSGYLIGTDKSSMHIADYNLWFELTKYGNCLNLREKTIAYRRSNQSMSRSLNKVLNYSSRYSIMKKVNKYYDIYPIYSFLQKLKVHFRILEYNLLSKIKR